MKQDSQRLGIIKVCPDPGCEAVYHNCPKKHTRCNDCGGHIMQINEVTYWKKFANNYFQYDFPTGDYFRPQKPVKQLSFDFAEKMNEEPNESCNDNVCMTFFT